MAYALTFNGSNYAKAPTLGNILSLNSIRVIHNDVVWPDGGAGTFHGKAASTSSNREYHFYVLNGNVTLIVGGVQNSLGTVSEVFGTSAPSFDTLDFFTDLLNGTFTLVGDGVTLLDAVSITIGTARVDGMEFRIGARSDDNSPGGGGAFTAPAGAQIGDTEVYLDEVLTRNYVAPSSGTTWPDTQNSQDATVSGGANWVNLDPSSFSVSITNHASGYAFGRSISGSADIDFDLTFGGSPTSIERSTDGGTTWATAVSSPTGNTYTDTVTLSEGQYSVQYRVSDDTSQTSATITTGVGPIFAIGGHSNAVAYGDTLQTINTSANGAIVFNYFNDGTIRKAVEPIDDQTNAVYSVATDNGPKGHWATPFVNQLLVDNPDVPIMLVPNAKGGSKLTDWYQSTNTGTLYGAMRARINQVGGVTAFLFGLGSSDSGEDISYAEATTRFETVFDALYAEFNAPVYLMSMQHYVDGRTESAQTKVRSAMQDYCHANSFMINWPSIYSIDLSNTDGIHFRTLAQINALGDACYSAYVNGDNSCLISVPDAADGEYTLTLSADGSEIINEPILINSGQAATTGFHEASGTVLTGQITNGTDTYPLNGVVGSTLAEEAPSIIPAPRNVSGPQFNQAQANWLRALGYTGQLNQALKNYYNDNQ